MQFPSGILPSKLSNISVFITVNLALLSLISVATWPIIDLVINENLIPDHLLDSELTISHNSSMNKNYPAYEPIPKILHQTYKTNRIPFEWNVTYSSVVYYNSNYTYMFWTDERSREFIATWYPWFLPTYDKYPYPIMRADAMRYFVLYHYGGIYIDLDVGCDFPLDPLLQFPAWLRKTDPLGVSNDVMGSVPHHPFFRNVIRELASYDRPWLLPYLRVMYSTGPLFLSIIRHRFVNSFGTRGPRLGAEVRILVPADHELYTKWFFFDSPGSTWHSWDSQIILFINNNAILSTMIILGLIFLNLYWEFKLIAMIRSYSSRRVYVKAKTWYRKVSTNKSNFDFF